ncbi:MAG: hypothetical protein HY001_03805 [Candidatus Portnoybacteria bacterium]|nr:hypothetical protein [Candidatus Portnoybacteria bacterium]
MSSNGFYDTTTHQISQNSKELAIPRRSGTLRDMPKLTIDPFENIRKNAYVWHGEKTTIWYQEQVDNSFTIIILYDFGDKKRRLFLDVSNKNQKVEFKNDEIIPEEYEQLKNEIKVIENIIYSSKQSLWEIE